MSAIHYYQETGKYRLTTLRPVNAATEIKMIIQATGSDALGQQVLDRLQATVEWLEGEVATLIGEAMAANKAAAESKKATKAFPSTDEVAKMTAAQLLEFANSRSIDLTGVKATKAARLAAVEGARPAEAPKAKAEKGSSKKAAA